VLVPSVSTNAPPATAARGSRRSETPAVWTLRYAPPPSSAASKTAGSVTPVRLKVKPPLAFGV
jgi:hypothetical protein